ncbi:hypothetical protein B9Z55_014760 [Caenorhabditis nigoni]|uniref:Uncharacterized protein n=1 Tax=Caenorhabditis nigoni TaxID=1611254 RepID=A0A2G5U764_9PELO|nr:hypothetical protein B9Z55_014760 [Caenorhabditis nigoni]
MSLAIRVGFEEFDIQYFLVQGPVESEIVLVTSFLSQWRHGGTANKSSSILHRLGSFPFTTQSVDELELNWLAAKGWALESVSD